MTDTRLGLSYFLCGLDRLRCEVAPPENQYQRLTSKSEASTNPNSPGG